MANVVQMIVYHAKQTQLIDCFTKIVLNHVIDAAFEDSAVIFT